MDFIDLAKKRYSVRKFDGNKVEREKTDMILEAGRIAPTAHNNQPQRILVLDTKENLEKLKNCTRYTFDAPLVFIVCYDKSVSWKRPFDNADMGTVDASIVTTHMMLETAALGLGSTWVAHFDPQKLTEDFSLPENIVPVAILPVGYPAKTSEPHPNHTRRFDINETARFNSFD